MAGKGSYLGGSTILKPWRDDVEEGWEPQSVVTGRVLEIKKNNSPEFKRIATPYEEAFIEFSKDCANADVMGIPRPDVPTLIGERYKGQKLRRLIKMISKNRFYKNQKRVSRRNKNRVTDNGH